MKKKENIMHFTESELREKRAESLTDLRKVDAMTDEKLNKIIDADEDEQNFSPDWTKARLILPEPKQSVNLRLDSEIVNFFKGKDGKGHIAKMQAVLKSYVAAHENHA